MPMENKEQNSLKYSKNGVDLIDEWTKIDYRIAVIACITKVQGYFRRYNSWADKADNEADLLKSFDYLERAKQVLPENFVGYHLFLRLQRNINERNFLSVDGNCKDILTLIINSF